ncbi:MAG: hypothetical protein JWN03_8472 [Nocardia sp.]|uniref:PPE domain-containing protein n=1 Tax=Nocardia sp. TaxID=1821 RepID=UPI002628C402|nr:PPE domain-containing protein [Nocardia sp.]MCU1648197.1 hypothetical protein [Nocardia sp.]
MVALNVDPQAVVEVATGLVGLARNTARALPSGWVVPAGADPISAETVPDLNAQTAALFNQFHGIMALTHQTAYRTGASAAAYSAADEIGARMINGSSGDSVVNPVEPPQQPVLLQAPISTLPSVGGAVDPLVFARQLHTGPGPGPANEFATAVRGFLSGPHNTATTGIDNAIAAVQQWTPVGGAVADELGVYRGQLDELGTNLTDLIGRIETYSQAFATAKAKHPTPQEITATRQELSAAMRSKNQFAMQDALAKFREQQSRSSETIGQYTATVNTKNSTAPTQSTGASSGNSASSGNDLSMMEQMLPSLISAMSSSGLGSLNQNSNQTVGSPSDYLPSDYIDPNSLTPLDSGGGGGTPLADPGGLPTADSAQSVAVGPMPMIAAAATASTSLPSSSVIEPLSTSAVAASAGRSAAGSPYMPYMPTTPGAGASGGGSDRARVVAWHPDRLMYVDDTPHTEAVIGEKPTITPLTTPATSVPQTPAQS